MFSENFASDQGGAIHSCDISYISFRGNSITKFGSNDAGYYGGVIHSCDNSNTYIF